MNADSKKRMVQTCSELDMSMITAFTIFVKKVIREQRIPFDVSVDPFHSESSLPHSCRGINALNAGGGW